MNTYLRPSYKKMIDKLYRTDDCSDFQKSLRFTMFNNWIQASVKKNTSPLSDKEKSLFNIVTNLEI